MKIRLASVSLLTAVAPVTSGNPEMTAELRAALAAGEEVATSTTEQEQ